MGFCRGAGARGPDSLPAGILCHSFARPPTHPPTLTRATGARCIRGSRENRTTTGTTRASRHSPRPRNLEFAEPETRFRLVLAAQDCSPIPSGGEMGSRGHSHSRAGGDRPRAEWERGPRFSALLPPGPVGCKRCQPDRPPAPPRRPRATWRHSGLLRVPQGQARRGGLGLGIKCHPAP